MRFNKSCRCEEGRWGGGDVCWELKGMAGKMYLGFRGALKPPFLNLLPRTKLSCSSFSSSMFQAWI
jgi:hypothetical protein